MKSITIYVLVHEYIPQAVRAVKSILNQQDPGFDIHIKVMVNTNDLSFLKKVESAMNDNFSRKHFVLRDILHSWSNGMPGKGKNACYNHWLGELEGDKTDYFMLIDGDDWLYPYALWHISQIENVDVIGLQSNDVINHHKISNSQLICKDPQLYLSTWGEKQGNLTLLFPRLMWMKNLKKFHTPSRTLIVKRESKVKIISPEDMFCYEDYVQNAMLLGLLEISVISYVHINCSGIYIADNSVAGQQERGLLKYDHQEAYEGHVRPLVEAVGNLNFNQVPFTKLTLHPTVNMPNKIDYITKTY